MVGERLRAIIEDTPFKISEGDGNITVTTSIGLSFGDSLARIPWIA